MLQGATLALRVLCREKQNEFVSLPGLPLLYPVEDMGPVASILWIYLLSWLHWRQELAGFKCNLNSSLDNGLIGCVFKSYLKYSRYHLVWETCCEFSFIHWGSSYRPSLYCLTTSGDLNYCYWDSQLGGDLFGLPIRGFRSKGQDDTNHRDVITTGAETIPLRIKLDLFEG